MIGNDVEIQSDDVIETEREAVPLDKKVQTEEREVVHKEFQ